MAKQKIIQHYYVEYTETIDGHANRYKTSVSENELKDLKANPNVVITEEFLLDAELFK